MEPEPTGTETDPTVPTTTPTVPVDPPEPVNNDEVYDPDVVQVFELELPPEAIEALSQRTQFDDPANDIYVHGTLTYGDVVLQDVGVRFKGEGSFRPLDEKSAWKLKLDEFVPDQNLLGLKRLTFNNMVEDPSFLAERMAFHVYRALNLPAPRCNSAVLTVNGENYGIYANIEAEDKTFLRRWFADDGANLYEEGQSDFVSGAETSFDLQTNETANDRSDLIALIAAVESVGDGAAWSELDAVLDTEHFLRFTAAEAAVNQWDMYAYTRFYPNNFRIYSDPSAGFTFLPWGMDLSMKPFRDSGKPHIRIYELARSGDFDGGQIIAGLIYQHCLQDSVCIETFSAAVSEVADVYESLNMEALAEQYYEQIRPHVEADPRKEYSMQQFEAGYEALLSTVRERPDAMRTDVAER
jgi:spore coat protein CotH